MEEPLKSPLLFVLNLVICKSRLLAFSSCWPIMHTWMTVLSAFCRIGELIALLPPGQRRCCCKAWCQWFQQVCGSVLARAFFFSQCIKLFQYKHWHWVVKKKTLWLASVPYVKSPVCRPNDSVAPLRTTASFYFQVLCFMFYGHLLKNDFFPYRDPTVSVLDCVSVFALFLLFICLLYCYRMPDVTPPMHAIVFLGYMHMLI